MRGLIRLFGEVLSVLPRSASRFLIGYMVLLAALSFLDAAALGLLAAVSAPILSGTVPTLPIIGEVSKVGPAGHARPGLPAGHRQIRDRHRASLGCDPSLRDLRTHDRRPAVRELHHGTVGRAVEAQLVRARTALGHQRRDHDLRLPAARLDAARRVHDLRRDAHRARDRTAAAGRRRVRLPVGDRPRAVLLDHRALEAGGPGQSDLRGAQRAA